MALLRSVIGETKITYIGSLHWIITFKAIHGKNRRVGKSRKLELITKNAKKTHIFGRKLFIFKQDDEKFTR